LDEAAAESLTECSGGHGLSGIGASAARADVRQGAPVLKRVEERNISPGSLNDEGSEWSRAERAQRGKRDRMSERSQAGGRPTSGRRWPEDCERSAPRCAARQSEHREGSHPGMAWSGIARDRISQHSTIQNQLP